MSDEPIIAENISFSALNVEQAEALKKRIDKDIAEGKYDRSLILDGNRLPIGLMGPKHDGTLGNCLRAHYDDNLVDASDLANTEHYHGVRVSGPYGYMPFTAKQALSLRDWLIQETPNLEKLAKEQEN